MFLQLAISVTSPDTWSVECNIHENEQNGANIYAICYVHQVFSGGRIYVYTQTLYNWAPLEMYHFCVYVYSRASFSWSHAVYSIHQWSLYMYRFIYTYIKLCALYNWLLSHFWRVSKFHNDISTPMTEGWREDKWTEKERIVAGGGWALSNDLYWCFVKFVETRLVVETADTRVYTCR